MLIPATSFGGVVAIVVLCLALIPLVVWRWHHDSVLSGGVSRGASGPGITEITLCSWLATSWLAKHAAGLGLVARPSRAAAGRVVICPFGPCLP
jgi:hypothetical protein